MNESLIVPIYIEYVLFIHATVKDMVKRQVLKTKVSIRHTINITNLSLNSHPGGGMLQGCYIYHTLALGQKDLYTKKYWLLEAREALRPRVLYEQN